MAVMVRRCLLLQHIKRKEMTQQEFADRLGISKQTLRHYITCRTIMPLEIAFNAAIILDCSVYDLYETVDVPLAFLKRKRSGQG